MKKIILFFLISFGLHAAYAQCSVDSLNISTGYDPIAGALTTPTVRDPKWTSTLSGAALDSAIGEGYTTGCYDIVPCGVWPSCGTLCTWMSALNYWGYYTSGSGADIYWMTLSRPFDVCTSDSLKFNAKIESDDWVSNMFLDGVPIFTPSSTPCGVTGFIAYSINLGMVAPGRHTLSIEVHNCNNGYYVNATGMALNGAIVSTRGRSSIVSESSFACGPVIDTSDAYACAGTSVTLHADTTAATYLWSTGATTYSIATSTAGIYWVDLFDASCHMRIDSIRLIPSTVADTFRYSTDTTICTTAATGTLTAPTGYTSYNWSTGSTASNITVTAAGTYWVTATSACGAVYDTFRVSFGTPPVVNLGNDTGFCTGNSTVLSTTQPAGYTLLWSTGATSSSIMVSATGTYWLQVSNGGCTTSDTVHVSVFPAPVVDLGPDITNCDGSDVTLSSSVSYSAPAYLWNTGASTPALTVTTSGTYWLQVSNGGCPGADTIHVAILYDTFKLVNRDTAICKGQVVQALCSQVPGATYQWLPTAGIPTSTIANPLITPDTSAEYVISVSFPGCPIKKDSFFLDVQPNPEVFIGGNRFVCLYDTIHAHCTVTPGWFSGYTYSWSPALSLDHTNTADVVFTAGATGTYYVNVTTSAGCKAIDSTKFIVQPGNFGVVIGNQFMCPGDSVQLSASGGSKYQWVPGLYLDDSMSAMPWVHAIATQTYKLVVTSAVGCKDTLGVTVTVWPNAVIYLADSTTIYPGESYQITTEGNCSGFSWFPPAGLNDATISNPIAAPTDNTKYYVTGTTTNGCKTLDSISVYVDVNTLINVPNAFTPGADHNAILYAIKRGGATLNYFKIFNRWGNEVFSTTNIDEGWDGNYKGTPQPFDVYVYELQAVTHNGILFTKHGNITLLR